MANETNVDSLGIKISASAESATKSLDKLIGKLNQVQGALKMGDVSKIVSNSMASVSTDIGNTMKKAESQVATVSKKIEQSFDDIAKKYGHIGVGFDVKGASKDSYQKYLNSFINQQANAMEKIQELEVGGKTGSQAYETAVKNYTILGNKIDSIKEKLKGFDYKPQNMDNIAVTMDRSMQTAKKSLEDFENEYDFFANRISKGDMNFAGDFATSFEQLKQYYPDAQELISMFHDLELAMEKIRNARPVGNNGMAEEVKKATYEIPKLTSGINNANQQAMRLSDIFRKLHVKSASDGLLKVNEQIEKTKQKYDQLAAKIRKAFELNEKHGNTMSFFNEQVRINGLINDYARLIQMQESLSRAAGRERMSAGIDRMKTSALKAVGAVGGLAKKLLNVATNARKTHSASQLFEKAVSRLTKGLTKMGRMLKLMITRMALRKIIENLSVGFKGLALYSEEFNQSVSMLIGSIKQLSYSISAAVGPLVNAFAPAINKIIQLCITAVNYINQLISALSGKGTWIRAKKQVVDYAKSLKGAGKEAKGALLALDELNNITTNSGGGSGADDINPDDMYETVEIESKILNLADKIKEMWKEGDFTELGTMVGTGIKNGLDKINWNPIQEKARKIGSSIATFINGFVETEDLGKKIGETIGNAFNTALYFVSEFVKNLHWREVGQFFADGINQLLATIDFAEFAKTISGLVNGLLDSLIGFLERTDWKKVGEKVAEFVGNIDWTGLADRLFEGIGAIIGGLASFIWGLISEAWQNVVNWWHDVAFEDGKFTITGLLNGIWEGMKNIASWLKDHVVTPLIDGIMRGFGIKYGASDVMKKYGISLHEGLLAGLLVVFPKITRVFLDLKNHIASTWNAIKVGTTTAWNGIVNAIKTPINAIIGFINRMLSGITEGLNAVIDTVKGINFEIPDWIPIWGGKKFEIKTPKLTAPQIQMLASGGYVQAGSYSLFAAGENGIPEILGTVGGKTAVAGGAEITGIKDAIYQTATEEVTLLRQQNQLLQGILQKEFGISKSDIGKAARDYGRDYYNRTGDNAYVF